MKRVLMLVEGQAEETFVHELLAPDLRWPRRRRLPPHLCSEKICIGYVESIYDQDRESPDSARHRK